MSDGVRTPSEPAPVTFPSSRSDRIVAAGFLIAILIPLLGFAVGIRPENLEARDITPFPAVDGAAAIGDPATFAGIDRFLADRFPFRTQAVRAHAVLDYGVLGGSTNPDVVVGRDGWLFPVTELEPVCDFTPAQTLAGLDAAAAAIRAAGMDLRFIVPPDKHSIFPDLVVPASGLGDACTDRQRADLQRGLRDRPGTAVELWDDLAAARATEDERPVYFATDTHWTPFGALIATRRLVDSIDPTVWDEGAVPVDGFASSPTNLSRLMGLPSEERIPRLLVRPGVELTESTVATDVDLRDARAIPWYRVPADVRAVEGRTLMVFDSFFGTNQVRIARWFRETVWVHYNDLFYYPKLAADLPAFDRIVLERVEQRAHDVDIEKLLSPLVDAARAGDRP